jgi:hypothetical protein
MLVMEQQMLEVQISLVYAGYQATNASNSNFAGFQLGEEQQVLNFISCY